MPNVEEDRPTNPDDFQEQQRGEEEKTLKEAEENKQLAPGDEMEWEHPAFDQTFTFFVPSAKRYREIMPNERMSGREDGTVEFQHSDMDPFLSEFVRPEPDLTKLNPGQLKALEVGYYNFVNSIFRGEAEQAIS